MCTPESETSWASGRAAHACQPLWDSPPLPLLGSGLLRAAAAPAGTSQWFHMCVCCEGPPPGPAPRGSSPSGGHLASRRGWRLPSQLSAAPSSPARPPPTASQPLPPRLPVPSNRSRRSGQPLVPDRQLEAPASRGPRPPPPDAPPRSAGLSILLPLPRIRAPRSDSSLERVG